MDNFYEQIVKQKLTPGARSARLIILMICPIIAFFIFLGILNCIAYGMSGLIIAIGLGGFAAGFGLYRVFTGFETEFEYTFTNGELDVDKISAKRKRERVLSVKLREADTDFRGKNVYCGKWYDGRNSVKLHFSGTKRGEVTLYFDPNDRMKECINPYLKAKI
jgi:hypothetical protein